MSNDTKTNPLKQPSRPEAIRIKHLRFKAPVDVPGLAMESAIRGVGPDEAQSNKKRHEVMLEPWARRFRIAWFEVGKDAPTTTIFVPEIDARSYEEW